MCHNKSHNPASSISEQKEKKVPRSCKIATFFPKTTLSIWKPELGYAHIIQLGGVNLKDYSKATVQPVFFRELTCPSCGASNRLSRHGKYARYVLVFEAGRLTWEQIIIVRVICQSCGDTHALLPTEIVAYCQYSLPVLVFIFTQILVEEKSVPQVAEQNTLSNWSVYLVMRRFEQCLARIGLVLFELGYQPSDSQRFTNRECLDGINRQGLSGFIHRYWQQTRRYLWQSRFHNRASPPVRMGWHESGSASFT